MWGSHRLVVTWPLAPNPPCEQVLAVVGVECWALIPNPPPSPCPLSSCHPLLVVGCPLVIEALIVHPPSSCSEWWGWVLGAFVVMVPVPVYCPPCPPLSWAFLLGFPHHPPLSPIVVLSSCCCSSSLSLSMFPVIFTFPHRCHSCFLSWSIIHPASRGLQ